MIDVKPIDADIFFSNPQAVDLCRKYREECGNRAFCQAAPDEDLYRKLIEAGVIHAAGAFSGNDLVGLVVVMRYSIAHFAGVPLVSVESIYLEPEYRKGSNGIALIKWAKDKAVSLGAKGLYLTAPAGSRLEKLGALLGRHTNTSFFLEAEHAA